jgi:hypothetical protein
MLPCLMQMACLPVHAARTYALVRSILQLPLHRRNLLRPKSVILCYTDSFVAARLCTVAHGTPHANCNSTVTGHISDLEARS